MRFPSPAVVSNERRRCLTPHVNHTHRLQHVGDGEQLALRERRKDGHAPQEAAVRYLAALFGCALGDCVAMCDDDNDLGMAAAVGHAATPSAALPER